MEYFPYRDGELYAEQVPLRTIANTHGTPCYVYSRAALETNWRALDEAFADYPHLVCFAVKANSNLAVLNLFARLGSGFDIVSGGELHRVLAAGGSPDKIVFSGVAKTSADIRAALMCGESGVRCINLESLPELHRVQKVAAECGRTARIGIRVNPDVDARTHPYIATGLQTSKFGMEIGSAIAAYEEAAGMDHIEIHSMACHIGSQITELEPFSDAVDRVAQTVHQLSAKGIELQQLDLGGGLGVDYQGESVPSAQDYVSSLLDTLAGHSIDIPVAIEPGRYIAGPAGVMLTEVEYLKESPTRSFAVVDAGMNDLMRPALYQAFHRIQAVKQKAGKEKDWQIVGPVCESADVLGTDRRLAIEEGDLLAVMTAGAYSFVMASNYNSRPRVAEVLVDGNQHHQIRARESLADLTAGETLLPD